MPKLITRPAVEMLIKTRNALTRNALKEIEHLLSPLPDRMPSAGDLVKALETARQALLMDTTE